MKTKMGAKSAKRRDFLKLAGLGTVAGAAAVVAKGGGQAKAQPAKTASAGYQETAHVKKVYDLSRF